MQYVAMFVHNVILLGPVGYGPTNINTFKYTSKLSHVLNKKDVNCYS